MEKNKQRELLEKIESITERKEAAQVYRQVFSKLEEYQEQTLRQIYQQIEDELTGNTRDYTVATLLCRKEEQIRFENGFEPFISAGMQECVWGDGSIQRIFISASHTFLEENHIENQPYQAMIQTNYETYPVLVKLKKVSEGLEQVRTLNKLMILNGLELPEINDIYIQKFYDVCFYQVNDRLRKDEKIEGIQVQWENLKPYIKEDVVLLWNVKKVNLKDSGFPKERNLIREIKYDHEIMLPHKNSAYLIDISKETSSNVIQTEYSIKIQNHHKEYTNWTAYEIMPVESDKHKNDTYYMMTNGIKKNIFTGLQKSRFFNTKCELYRRAMSYEMADMFQYIEVQENGELLFYPKEKENALNGDVMEFILQDMSLIYGRHKVIGRLVEDEE